MAAVGFGWVVDDDSPAKRVAGDPAAFVEALVRGQVAACDPTSCPTCELLDESLACVGVIEAPIGPQAEEWLAGRLPPTIDSLPGQLLRQNLKEGGITGAGGEELRKRGMMAAPKPFTKHYGPFFRGFTVTTDQLFEEMLCAGDIQPAHALAVLVHLGGIAVDDRVPAAPDDGAALSDIVQHPESRAARTLCTIHIDDADDRSTVQIKRFLRALYAGFVQDTEIRVLGG
ncbi:MAG: hypothetical protein D6689_13200 [Deltaproteobacteria bacterium]|nr:MAG: hypothetical protein D6689_13200 [Deltaproteobacteria bacterium]